MRERGGEEEERGGGKEEERGGGEEEERGEVKGRKGRGEMRERGEDGVIFVKCKPLAAVSAINAH